MTKKTQPSATGKYTARQIKAAVVDWEQQTQGRREPIQPGGPPPSVVGLLCAPPTQWPDCMQYWMQAYMAAKRVDQISYEIWQKTQERNSWMVEMSFRNTQAANCAAGHQV